MPCLSRHCLVLGFVLALWMAESRPALAQARFSVDLELVLAVDASSSVNRAEFDLQMRGLAEAFRHPDVQAAIAAAAPNGMAVMLMQWADSRNQLVAIDWQIVRTPGDAEAFAEAIDMTARLVEGGGTAIGGAIAFAQAEIESNPYEGGRRVIDVSGDGRSNQGESPQQVRERVLIAGTVINGLAILNEDSALHVYYGKYVIGGSGAFVVSAQHYEVFGEAIRDKLLREIGGAPVAMPAPVLPPPDRQQAQN